MGVLIMRRLLLLGSLGLLISACSIDPCSIDQTSPTCDTRRSEARATIGAIDSANAVRATDSAVYLAGQATKSAISSQATRTVIDGDATHIALQTQGTRQAVSAAGTASAVQLRATQTSIDGEATRIAVNTNAVVERARAESAATPYSAVFNIVLLWFALPALIVGAVIIYGRRSIHAATQSLAQSLAKRAALVTYGPANNPQMALVMFDPATQQPVRLVTPAGLLGPYAQLADGSTALDRFDLPDELKLAALVEGHKRSQAGRIAAATGSAPWRSSISYDAPAQISAPPLSPPASAMSGSVAIPSFADLLRTWRPTQQQMLLGLDDRGQRHYCELQDLLSTGVVGRPKMGKSTVLRFIYLQCRLIGAQVFVWDIDLTIVGTLPDAHAYTEIDTINASAQEVIDIFEQRRRARLYTGQPIMILVDEFNRLAPRSDIVMDVMNRIILGGRKYQIFSMISGHGFPAKLFGESTPRDALSSRFVLRTTPGQAQMLGLDKDARLWVTDLRKGQAVVDGPIEPKVLYIPNTTEADIKAFLPASSLSSEPLRPLRPTSAEVASEVPRSTSEVVSEAANPFDEVDAEAARCRQIVDLFRSGVSQNAIIKQMYNGVTGGEKYQRAAREIREIIQREMNP
jgi:hypothetical protein